MNDDEELDYGWLYPAYCALIFAAACAILGAAFG
jgi:hypothetical protein